MHLQSWQHLFCYGNCRNVGTKDAHCLVALVTGGLGCRTFAFERVCPAGRISSACFTREPQGRVNKGLGDAEAIGLHAFQGRRDPVEFADASGLQQNAEHAEQGHALAEGGLAAASLVDQYTASQRVGEAQGLRFAFVQIAGGGSVDVVVAGGVNPGMGLHEYRDVGSSRARAIRRGLIEHGLWHMETFENGGEQFKLTAAGQRGQRPGVGDDNGLAHRAASKAASSCSSSAGS